MFFHEYHKLIVEEEYVTYVLDVINRHQGFFSNVNKRVGDCKWPDDPDKWYVHFYASAREWERIAKDLSELGEIRVQFSPRGTADLYYTRT